MIKRKVKGVGFILVLILIVCQRSIVLAQSTEDAEWRSTARWDQVDETGTADIHKFTTDPKYITPIVSYIPDHETVPSPRDVLGHIVGADDYLTNVEEEYRYFDALAAASPRVTIQELGLT